jgi:hypothetical protein
MLRSEMLRNLDLEQRVSDVGVLHKDLSATLRRMEVLYLQKGRSLALGVLGKEFKPLRRSVTHRWRALP